MTALTGWQNFYVIVGSSAGALIGLQFVVLTLIAGGPALRDGEGVGKAFATPTIVHFGAVLVVSAILNAPWRSIGAAATLWGVLGVVGLVYVIIVARHMRRLIAYTLQFEDRLCHVLLPLGAYATLAGTACAAPRHMEEALFGVAAAVLFLLFIGIHNAWDAVTYHVFVRGRGPGRSPAE